MVQAITIGNQTTVKKIESPDKVKFGFGSCDLVPFQFGGLPLSELRRKW